MWATSRLRLAVAVLAMGSIVASAQAQEISTYVAADDGTLLATDVYLPPYGSEPWPVALVRTPYDKSSLTELGIAVSLLEYAVVIQDTRGRYASEGDNSVFRDDAADGRATVRWIEQQPWCDGHIGGVGGSAFAITQYLLAPAAGPSLSSIMAVVATPDLYHHAFLQGGALRESLAFNWLADQDALNMYDEVRRHRLKTEWWDPAEVLGLADRVTASGLHVGGWYDIFGQGTLDAFTTIQRDGGTGARDRQYLVMGPWTHGSLGDREVGELIYPPNAALDPLGLVLPWLSHTLRGSDNQVADWAPVLVYLMGAAGEQDAPGNRWIELDHWPPETSSTNLFLTDGGELAIEPPAAGSLALTVDPADPVPTLGGANLYPDLVVDNRAMGDGPHDLRPIEARDDVIAFTSGVLSSPIVVMGRVSCTLWLQPDTADLDLAVRLSDVYPDGRSMLVLDGIQRVRMRCGDDRECLAVPGQPIEIAVDLWSTALAFNAGHRVRISLSGSNAPRFEVNPNNGGALDGDDPPVVARPELLLGEAYPSRLRLPVVTPPRRADGRRGPPDEPLAGVAPWWDLGEEVSAGRGDVEPTDPRLRMQPDHALPPFLKR